MTRANFRKWKDFSIRMAKYGWPPKETQRREHQQTVIPFVEAFFETLAYVRGWPFIEDWDNTHPGGDFIVCDIVEEMMESWNPYYYDSEDMDTAYDAWDEMWGGRIRSCIRAGIDLVSGDAGVYGFTKADIDRMYPDGVPGYVMRGWATGEDGEAVAWRDIDDGAVLWL